MPLVVMMHESSSGEQLASAAFKHHTDPTGLRHYQRVGMLHRCSAGELLARAVLVHHDDKMSYVGRPQRVKDGIMPQGFMFFCRHDVLV